MTPRRPAPELLLQCKADPTPPWSWPCLPRAQVGAVRPKDQPPDSLAVCPPIKEGYIQNRQVTGPGVTCCVPRLCAKKSVSSHVPQRVGVKNKLGYLREALPVWPASVNSNVCLSVGDLLCVCGLIFFLSGGNNVYVYF